MSVKATIQSVDTSGIARKLDQIKSNDNLGRFAASEAKRLMAPYVPRREGILEGSAEVRPWSVVYNTPYARRQYYDKSFNHPSPPNIRGRSEWDKGIDKDALTRAITRYLNGR